MARYIDADKLIAHLKDELKGCHLPFGSRSGGKGIAYGTILGLKSAISFAETLPTADVVPKSEGEELKVMLEITNKAYESLRELYHIDTNALVEARRKTEVEVAREIFEEIEILLRLNSLQGDIFIGKYFDVDLENDIAELKKKYIQD